MLTRAATASLLAALFVSACQATPPGDDFSAEDDDGAEIDGKADGAAGLNGYYLIKRGEDTAFEIRRANRSTMKCASGRSAKICKFDAIEFYEHSGLDARAVTFARGSIDGGELLVRGAWAKTANGAGSESYSYFDVTEAWRPASSVEPTGTFALVTDSACDGDAPSCPRVAHKLNSTKSQPLDAIDLDGAELSSFERPVYERRVTDGGIVLAGELREQSDGTMAYVATQAYVQLTGDVGEGCALRCNGFVCGAKGASGEPGECEWSEPDLCEGWSRCEADADGACAWRATEDTDLCNAAN